MNLKVCLSLLLLSTSFCVLGQNPEDKVGEIQVDLIVHAYKLDEFDQPTKRRTNKRNRPNISMFFNTEGQLLKGIGYGKHHNTDLRLIDQIEIYQYNSLGLVSRIDIYETDYAKNLSHKYYALFDRDSTGVNTISKRQYDVQTDSLFFKEDYWYNEKGQYQGERMSPSYYYKRSYDDKGDLIALQQIYNDSLRWDWKYTYENNQRIGIFQTYYKDGDDYTKKEIRSYNGEGYLVENENRHTSRSGLDLKSKFYYNSQGIVERIEFYQRFSLEEGYKLYWYQDTKVRSKVELSPEAIKRINDIILKEEE